MNLDDHYLPDLRPYSKINIGTPERPVWIYVSHTDPETSSAIAREIAGEMVA